MKKKIGYGFLFAMLLLMGSVAKAQTNGQFVIKIEGHYLAHSGGSLTDATTFDPATCLWTSDNTYSQGGTNKNYYYMDGTTPRFLSAPTFAAGGALSLSNGLPTASMSVPESPYYFYKWDGGLGRGVQYYGACTDSTYCVDQAGHTWGDGQCWDVFWVAYLDNTWKLSDNYYNLNSVPTGGKFYAVTITEHPQETTIVSGAVNLQGFELEYQQSQQVNPTIPDYTYSVRPAYTTYLYEGTSHHFYGEPVSDHNTIPGSTPYGPVNPSSYAWSITGEGAQYLSIDNNSIANPTISYNTANNTGHKTATLTLTVTYAGGATQTSSTTILVKTPCQNPTVLTENTEVTYAGVTVSWVPTAESYKVSWQKQNTSTWEFAEVGNVTSYTITGLEYNSTYTYKVQATSCTTQDPSGTLPTFTTLSEPGLMITGAIFGGGRMANVGHRTEVVVINCDSIGAIYGGNDIAGVVADSSIIVLGVDAGGTYASYGTTPNNGSIRVSSVYGGGNGYYAYNGSSFAPATSNTFTVTSGSSVTTQSQTNDWNEAVWTNSGSSDTTMTLPSITRTLITVTNDKVKIDTVFGGAKNAYITAGDGNGSDITVNGGTILAVFGGNNIGGGQGYGWHSVTVNATTTNLTDSIVNTPTTGYGRNFGIRNLFGGGNKVTGSSTGVQINGGQIDNVFAGGNSADVYRANVTVNCAIGTNSNGDGITFNKLYSNAITYNGSAITPKTDYSWNGVGGIYNVRTLYGGNNEAEMTRVPTMTLTSGSVGTVYGGGNAGDMMGNATDDGTGHDLEINGNDVQYGTHVVMNSASFIADYLYGGCRMSNVANSTWVELKKGHVGTVYGGCNISGDVGSTRVNVNAPTVPATLADQEVKGGTYVVAGGGNTDNIIVYKNLFAGSNGYYDCSTDGIHYISDEYFDDPTGQYEGLEVPTHNETNVVVSTGATIKGNVYAGGNLASVGFDSDNGWYERGYPELVGLASVRMDGGLVEQNVYGGGNMASIFGKNEVMVTGGTIRLGLYGGNDRAGQVAEKTNRIMPDDYNVASDGKTSLTDLGVKTYVGVSGNAQIGTVYGGGNGDYPPGSIHYCHASDNEPIQSYTFVDVHINGGTTVGTDGGHIGTVYGGGNGVTIRGGATVFLNIQNPVNTRNHVDTIFGGNNKGDLVIVPDVLLLHGQVGTVYGGCNRGAMTADANISNGSTTVNNLETVGGYENVGSYVQLRSTYEASADSTHNVDAKVSEAVYGGCRMNGVTRNSLVLVEGGNFLGTNLYGGSDISGTVSGFSRVAVTGGTVGDVYGGGNGNYTYNNNGNVYTIPVTGDPVLVATGITSAPICAQSGVDVIGGQVGDDDGLGSDHSDVKGNVFGGGYGHKTSTTGNVVVNVDSIPNVNAPVIFGDIYGGSAMGSVNSSASDSTTVNILHGYITGDVYGGGLGYYDKNVDSIAALSYGKTYVNIGADNNGTYTGNVTFNNGRVFGANNQYGSPLDSVFVNIYKTAHTAGNSYPSTPTDGWNVTTLATNASTQTYAISAVYGGGNLAAYTPTVANRGSIVHVYGCDNTIHSVFGGGNAADVGTGDAVALTVTNQANTNVIVEGGRIHRVIGGGNGEDPNLPAANIFGIANTTVYAGLIDEIYGGANIKGSVDDINLLISNPQSAGFQGCANYDDEVYGMVFGCANAAPYNKSVTTTIECGVGEIGALYGGSNQNYIGNPDNHNSGVSVTLNLYGGEYLNVFAGSKGVAADPAHSITGVAANIYGDVNLNLYGGKITNAFGGCDANGNVTGVITVNVLDHEGTCALDVENIYGASNLTAYTPDNSSTLVSPVVNVIHIKNEHDGTAYGIRGNVFGGGNLAEVTSNPKVNIGYHSSMAIPSGYPIVEANRIAKVSGDVFGGGNQAGVTGNDTVIIRRANSYANNLFGGGNLAGVTGNPVIIVENGTVNSGIYGGCNTNGTVTGDIEVDVIGGTLGADGARMYGIFGGGYGAATKTSGNVTLNVGDASNAPTIYADVYGGSALGDVHTEGGTTDDITTINFAKGTLHGNLYGGGLGYYDHGVDSIAAQVNGNVEVNIGKDNNGTTVTGGFIYGSVFGANNIYGSPEGSVTVNVYSATTDSIFGGGNMSAYVPTTASIAYPAVNISGGVVKYKVVGGGNAAGVTANPHINISGGQVCTDNSALTAGVYGGCNTSGIVDGDITINITGSNSSQTTIGTMTDLEAHNPVSVHGGGYGQATGTTGNITINFGTANEVTTPHCEYPMLYGDLYGGSALGDVNNDDSDETTVNILNGSLKYYEYESNNKYYQEGGNIYGGGLGRKADVANGITAVEAKVWGDVHVNIGAARDDASSDPFGQASLVHCNVYGCNNTNGSPQQNVYVDVYQTQHISTDVASYMGSDRTYAIANVFGGGNQANFEPDVNNGWTKKTNTTIHYCNNTIENVYGGGNAADTDGTVVWVDGGRFNNIFGGGNGQVSEANIGEGSTDMTLMGGHVAYYFQGCNMHGEVGGTQHLQEGCPTGETCECDALVIENHYFGANQATVYNGINDTVNCGQVFTFRKVYAGSRLATIYGDIRLTIRGGQIQYLFGGCEGSADISANVKKYPSLAWAQANDSELYDWMVAHGGSTLEGKGGNIILTLEGGDIGTVFGGCDYRGIVEGTIQIIVDSTQTGTCGLDIDYIYGGNNLAAYTAPANTISPLVELRNGHVNFDVFGGSLGGSPSHLYGNGLLTGKPKVIVGDSNASHHFRIGRDLFGGGSAGKVVGDTQVILQGKTTIQGNVFGGGKVADVQGNTNVTIVPNP